MQYIGDDMEDLFQRAADNYSLDAGPDGWATIAQKIAEGKPILPEIKSYKKYRKSVTIFLLIFLFSGGLCIVLNNHTIPLHTETSTKYAVAHVLSNQHSYQQPGTKTATLQQTPSYKIIHHNSAVKPIVHKTIPITLAAFTSNLTRLSNVGVAALHEGMTNKPKITQLEIPHQNSSEPLAEANTTNNRTPNQEPSKNASEIISSENKTVVLKNAGLTHPFKKAVYFGLVAGGDFSKVKSMPFNHAGLSAGVTLEYKFAKQWSLQSGIIVDRKNYLGEGVKFNIDKVRNSMTGMTIKQFEGRSTLIEIPLTVKLYLNSKPAHHFFIMTGIASYVVTNETNQYDVMHNGQPEKVSGNYKSNNYNAIAVATLSAGYQKKLSHNAEISLAPYFNIPLRGVGVGSLPITSAGIRIVLSTRVK